MLCILGEKKLDILINNAGATWIPERKTVDGFESIFATNYLGNYCCYCKALNVRGPFFFDFHNISNKKLSYH